MIGLLDGTWLYWMQKSNLCQTETCSHQHHIGFVEGKLTEIPHQSIETRDAPIVGRQNRSPFSKQSRSVRRSAFQMVFLCPKVIACFVQ